MADDDFSPELRDALQGIEANMHATDMLQPFIDEAKRQGLEGDEAMTFVRDGVKAGMKKVIIQSLTADPEYPFKEPELFDAILKLAREGFE